MNFLGKLAALVFICMIIALANLAGPQGGSSVPHSQRPWYDGLGFLAILIAFLLILVLWGWWEDGRLKRFWDRLGKRAEQNVETLEADERTSGGSDVDAQANGKVNVSLDENAIPGTMVSGKATFSDGKTVGWYLDQFGRLALNASKPGYQPPTEDVPVFQRQLQQLLAKQGV